jgi:DNA mismatch repair protein MLH1
VQHGVKLYLVDYAAVSYELFYQIGLSDFANFGHIRLNPPLALRDLLEIAAKEEQGSGNGADDLVDPFDWEGATKVMPWFFG